MDERTDAMAERGLAALVLVCTNDRAEYACCADAGGVAVADAAREWFRERELFWSRVAVVETGCLGMCSESGAAVVVQPRNEWYAEVDPADVPALLAGVFGEEGTRIGDPVGSTAAD